MNQISDNPGPMNFGHEFNYEQWTPDTTITLCNVPWNNDYRDVWGIESHAELNDYIDSLQSPRVQITNATYAKLNVPVKVGMTLNKARKYNYLRASNGIQPVVSGDEKRDYYYFIVGIREVNPETTELTVQLDVWATWFPEISRIRGYIERGHVGIANEKRMQNFGRDYLTIPEGFDLGTEYQTIAKRYHKAMDDINMDIIGVFSTDPEAAPLGGDGKPNYTTASGSNFQNIPSGAVFYVWNNTGKLQEFLNANKNHPWITQGLLSIMLVPNLSKYYPGFNFSGEISAVKGVRAPENKRPETFSRTMWVNWRDSDEFKNLIPERYRHLDKLKTFPYMVIEMTTFTATPIMLKPENWSSASASIMERVNLMPPNARVQFAPRFYNVANNAASTVPVIPVGATDTPLDDGGDYWDMFTQITNLPTVPIVNDGAILALANSANSIAFQTTSADWSQQRALAGAQTAYDQATSGMNTSSALGDLSNQNAYAQTMISQELARQTALTSAVSGIGGGAGMGAFAGPAGAAAGAIGGAIGAASNGMNLGNNLAAQNAMLSQQYANTGATIDTSNQNAGFVRDTNNDLAKFAAKGDYQNTIAGINAKVRDLQMTPASVVGQMGGELINMVNGTMGVSMRWKMIDPAAMRRIGDHWLRYGYAIGQWAELPQNLHVMEKFTYWKMAETYITGGFMPENYRQAIRGILEKGVTVWKHPSDIGQIDIGDNMPLTGISLP